MSGSDAIKNQLPVAATFTCNKCKTIVKNVLHKSACAIACSYCGEYFIAEKGFGYKHKHSFKPGEISIPVIPLNTKGKINGITYELVGFAVRREVGSTYDWREYILFNPTVGFATFAEFNGHWNFVQPISDYPVGVKQYERQISYRNLRFKLYNKYKSTVKYAVGEFHYDIFEDKKNTNAEWISPPFILIREKSSDKSLWSLGEYFTEGQIKSVFNVHDLPEKTGVGATQLMKLGISLRNLIISSTVCVAVMLVSQMYFSDAAANEKVFEATYYKSSVNKEGVIVTPAFTLNGGTKALQYDVYAAIQNDWFDVNIELINDATGERFEVAKSLEFYSGYDSEGAWSEGGNADYIIVSSVPEGKYHLNLYPQWNPNLDAAGKPFTIRVFRDVSLWANFWIMLLIVSVAPLIQYMRVGIFETKRWAESDYSTGNY